MILGTSEDSSEIDSLKKRKRDEAPTIKIFNYDNSDKNDFRA